MHRSICTYLPRYFTISVLNPLCVSIQVLMVGNMFVHACMCARTCVSAYSMCDHEGVSHWPKQHSNFLIRTKRKSLVKKI